MDSLLTVILIIRDRPFYTFRWMNYANTTKFPFKILIADGGKDQSVEENLKNPSHYPNLNYQYLRYPYDVSPKEYLYKIADALNQVKTPYVVLADDDDFWNVEGLRASVQFLEENSDYATCRGRNFIFIKNKKTGAQFNPHSISQYEQTALIERVMASYQNLEGTFYDVHRTSNYANTFKKIADINFHFLPMIEIMVAVMDAVFGKIKRLDIPYLLREYGHGQSTSSGQDHFSRLLSGPCSKNLIEMCDYIAQVLNQNTLITKNVVEAIQDTGVKKVIYTSSSEVYGEPTIVPTPETHPILLNSAADRDSYAISKAIGEFYVRLYAEKYKIHWLILRVFNMYGPRMINTKYGQVIPEFIHRIQTEKEFTLIGDGHHTRSFCFIQDAIRLILNCNSQNVTGFVNLGNPEEISILNLAKKMHKLVGKNFNPVFLPERPHDHHRRCPDITKLISCVGNPNFIALEDGLKSTIECSNEI